MNFTCGICNYLWTRRSDCKTGGAGTLLTFEEVCGKELSLMESISKSAKHNLEPHDETISKMLGICFNPKNRQFEVSCRWRDFAHEELTWEPLPVLRDDFPKTLVTFLDKYPDQDLVANPKAMKIFDGRVAGSGITPNVCCQIFRRMRNPDFVMNYVYSSFVLFICLLGTPTPSIYIKLAVGTCVCKDPTDTLHTHTSSEPKSATPALRSCLLDTCISSLNLGLWVWKQDERSFCWGIIQVIWIFTLDIGSNHWQKLIESEFCIRHVVPTKGSSNKNVEQFEQKVNDGYRHLLHETSS